LVSSPLVTKVGPAPADPVVASTSVGIVSSRDTGCTWAVGSGGFPPQNADDVFPDPTDASHVLAIGYGSVDGGVEYGVYSSTDGGRTFASTPTYLAPVHVVLTGVEIARSSPGTLYIAMFQSGHPSIVRSTNGGTSFTTFDLSAMVTAPLGIAAVDPVTSTTLYLRANTSPQDSLAISIDGGMTVRLAVQLSAAMSAFLRRADGTLLVTSVDGKGFPDTPTSRPGKPSEITADLRRAPSTWHSCARSITTSPIESLTCARSSRRSAVVVGLRS